MKSVIKFIIILAIGFLIGYSYKSTKTETGSTKTNTELIIKTEPKVQYIKSTDYIIVPIVKDLDTLVRPRDYQYEFKELYKDKGIELEVDLKGWGDIQNIEYKVIKTDAVQKHKPLNNLYISTSYNTTLRSTTPLIGIHIDYTIRDRILIGTSILKHNNEYYTGIKIGYRL